MNGYHRSGERGFTLIELMIVVTILGIVFGIAAPVYNDSLNKSREAQCFSNRKSIESTAIYHFTQNTLLPGTPIPTASEMVTLGYLDLVPNCPSGGTYVWAKKNYSDNRLPELGCSVHFIPKSN